MRTDTLHDLLTRYAATRSEPVFAEFVTRAGPLVWRVAMRRLDDAQLAEEVSQNVFLRVDRKAGLLAGRAGLTAWLHRAAALEAANFARSRRRKAAVRELAATAAAVESGGAADRWENQDPPCLAWLDEALDSLPGEDRAVLLGRYYEERGFRELAALLGKTEEAAKKQNQRALTKLRALLERRGITLSSTALAGVAGTEFSSAAALPTGLAAQVAAVCAATSPGVTALSVFTRFTLLMSTPKAVSCAAVLICLLLATAAWLDVDNREQRSRLAALLRQTRGPAVGVSPLGTATIEARPLSAKRLAATGLAEETPPDPLTGEALVRAMARDRKPTLYDPGFWFSAALEVWAGLPVEEWARLLAEVDASLASAGIRQKTASALLALSAERDPAWAAEELLRRKDPTLGAAMRQWADKDPAAAWRWIRAGVRTERLLRHGAGPEADPESTARGALAGAVQAMQSHDAGALATEMLASTPDPAERHALLADLTWELGRGDPSLMARFLSGQSDPAVVQSVLTRMVPLLMTKSDSPQDSWTFLSLLVADPAFPQDERRSILREGLSRMPAEKLWTATYAMARANDSTDPANRSEDLVWLAETFAANHPADAPPPAAEQPEMASLLEESARALEQKGNPELAAWYRAGIPSRFKEVNLPLPQE